MDAEYGCVNCGSKLILTRKKVEKPTDRTDVPHEIVQFKCPECANEFKARTPPHPNKSLR